MKTQILSLGVLVCMLALLSCDRDTDDLELATYPVTANVFIDGFAGDMDYAAFGGSKPTAFDVDTEIKYAGDASMIFEVPDFEDPLGSYAGGTYLSSSGRDLSGFNVLTFWAKASRSASIDVIGFGNDLGENKYQVSIDGMPVNTNWQKYYIPIPNPSKLTAERGLLFYSEGPENEEGYTFWLDEVQFENLGTIAHADPRINNGDNEEVTAEIGDNFTVNGSATFNLPTGVDQAVNVSPAYFTFVSSDPSVASVDDAGKVSVVGQGTAVITATLNGIDASGSLTIISTGEAVLPTTPAPMPVQDASDVISVFSDKYTDVPVDFYNGYWQFSTTVSEIVQVQNDDIIRYTMLNFVGIQFTAPTIDAGDMTHFHLDIWTPEPADEFKILLVDMGPDGTLGTGDDSSHELTFNAPKIVSQEWVSFDIKLSDFVGLTSTEHLAQIVLSGNIPTVFADNIYFYKKTTTSEMPTEAAPTPLHSASDVISLFSDAYVDEPVDTWRTDWSSATLEEVSINGNATKKYSALDFVGIETVNNQIDASDMTHFHVDVWSADATSFSIKLVDFGADGAFGGADDSEHQIDFPAPDQGVWISYDIPLSDFTNLQSQSHMAQYILVAQPTGTTTIYTDNFYFHK